MRNNECPHGHPATTIIKNGDWTEEYASAACMICPPGTQIRRYKVVDVGTSDPRVRSTIDVGASWERIGAWVADNLGCVIQKPSEGGDARTLYEAVMPGRDDASTALDAANATINDLRQQLANAHKEQGTSDEAYAKARKRLEEKVWELGQERNKLQVEVERLKKLDNVLEITRLDTAVCEGLTAIVGLEKENGKLEDEVKRLTERNASLERETSEAARRWTQAENRVTQLEAEIAECEASQGPCHEEGPAADDRCRNCNARVYYDDFLHGRCGACAVDLKKPEQRNETQQAISDECDALKKMLLEKNAAYGNSALDPVRAFSKASPVEQILVRLDDKLSRLARGSAAGENVEKDIMGYLVLLRIARRRMETTNADAE